MRHSFMRLGLGAACLLPMLSFCPPSLAQTLIEQSGPLPCNEACRWWMRQGRDEREPTTQAIPPSETTARPAIRAAPKNVRTLSTRYAPSVPRRSGVAGSPAARRTAVVSAPRPAPERVATPPAQAASVAPSADDAPAPRAIALIPGGAATLAATLCICEAGVDPSAALGETSGERTGWAGSLAWSRPVDQDEAASRFAFGE